jgi:hypothetical protein
VAAFARNALALALQIVPVVAVVVAIVAVIAIVLRGRDRGECHQRGR